MTHERKNEIREMMGIPAQPRPDPQPLALSAGPARGPTALSRHRKPLLALVGIDYDSVKFDPEVTKVLDTAVATTGYPARFSDFHAAQHSLRKALTVDDRTGGKKLDRHLFIAALNQYCDRVGYNMPPVGSVD